MPPEPEPAWEVPAYRATPLGTGRRRYALCVFVLDEGERVLRQLGRMRAFTGEVDVVLADGGSTDGSTEPGRLSALGVHTLLVKEGPGRLSAQMRMALAHCLRAGYEGV